MLLDQSTFTNRACCGEVHNITIVHHVSVANRCLIVNLPDSLTQQICYTKDCQLWETIIIADWNGIRDDYLLEHACTH